MDNLHFGSANSFPLQEPDTKMRRGAKKRGVSFAVYKKNSIFALGFQTADMAQLVEHFIRNERVRGSSPRVGSGVRGKSGSDVMFLF